MGQVKIIQSRAKGPITLATFASVDENFLILLERMKALSTPSERARLLARMAEAARKIIRGNFLAGGRPVKWAPSGLVKSQGRFRRFLIKVGLRKGAKTLIQTGELMNSFEIRVTANTSSVITRLIKARALHFGSRVGRGLQTKLPARPFMIIPQSQVKFLEFLVQDELQVLGLSSVLAAASTPFNSARGSRERSGFNQ